MKVVCIVWCFIISLAYGRGIDIEFNSTNESEPISATWADFQVRHIVGSDQGSAANWNAYFRAQMPGQYGIKKVNTFVVNSAGSISQSFPTGVPQYTGGSASNLFWSSTPQRQFVLTLTGGPSPNYNVYDCGQQYFVAGLDMTTRLPVHYQGHSSTQGPKIDQIIAGCTKVASGRQYFFGLVDLLFFLGFLFGIFIGLSVVWLLNFDKFRGNAAVNNEHSPLIGNNDPNDKGKNITTGGYFYYLF